MAKMTAEMITEAVKMIQGGKRNFEIAEELGVDPSQISHIRRGYTGKKAFPEDRAKHRLLSRSVQVGDCLEWSGSLCGKGYGATSFRSKQVTTHRLAYLLFVGAIPPGMFVCHTCDNMKCIRPDHLWLGTHQDNMTDMALKGRGRKPSKSY